MIEPLRELTEDELAAIPMPFSDDEEDTGNPDVFTLFDPVYEVELQGDWYTTNGDKTFHMLKTRTNDVIFMEEFYIDNPGAGSLLLNLPEAITPSVNAYVPVLYANWSQSSVKVASLQINTDGSVCLCQIEGSEDKNKILSAGLSYNCSNRYYL